ncbi:MAG: disulfide bond formation protein B [Rhodospirillaceae bacterium]|nr:disulfide bond formation protein B [Rhodospirillaceae bacterium]
MTLQNRSFFAIFGIALASAGALGLALVAQYGFDLWPCTICYWQRVPYGLTLALAVLAMMPVVDGPSRRMIVLLCAGLFLLNAGIALYHTGVEERWWQGPTACAGKPQELSPTDLLAALNQPGRTSCEDAAFRFLGLSMAGYNIIACLVLAFGSWMATRRDAWWK